MSLSATLKKAHEKVASAKAELSVFRAIAKSDTKENNVAFAKVCEERQIEV